MLHLSVCESDTLAAKIQDGPDGTFLFRARNPETPLDRGAVLMVIFKGKPTSHLVIKSEVSGYFEVNRNPCGNATALKQV